MKFGQANKLGNGIVKMLTTFKPILADCKLFLSQTFYYQLTGKQNDFELGLLKDAIKYSEESIELNPMLSQSFYHCAKYLSYGIANFNEFKAFFSSRNIRLES